MQTCLNFPLGAAVPISVNGVASNDRVQALEVKLPSWVPYYNPTQPHVTISIIDGAEAKESGILIKEASKSGEVEPIHGLRILHGVIGVCLTDRSIVYSEKALREAVQGSELLLGDGIGGKESSLLLGEEESKNITLGNVNTSTVEDNATNGQMHQDDHNAVDKEEETIDLDLVALMRQCLPSMESNHEHEEERNSISNQPHLLSTQKHAEEVQEELSPETSMPISRPRRKVKESESTKKKSSSRKNAAQHSREGKKVNTPSQPWWKPGSVSNVNQHPEPQMNNLQTPSSISISSTSTPSTTTTASVAAATALAHQLAAAESEREAMHAHHAAYKAAKEAHNEAKADGDSRTARAYAAGAQKHAAAIVSARRRASAVAFTAHNASLVNTFKVDLHGMHVKEAIGVLRRYIEGLRAVGHPGGVLLRVVTGKN